MRDDLHPDGRAPKPVEDFLVRLAGRNPYGEAKYRVCLAQHRVTMAGGIWHDWRDEATVQERGGLVMSEFGMTPSGEKPLRVVAELRTIPRYPLCECREVMIIGPGWDRAFPNENLVPAAAGECQECEGLRGWIVEKWVPAHKLNKSESEWYQDKVPGFDIPVLGPYPSTGEYIRIPKSRVTAKVPSLQQLGELVLYLESHSSKSELSDEAYRKQREEGSTRERERVRMAHMNRNRAMIRRSLEPLLGNTLRAGAEREKYARRLRERGVAVGHVGN